MYNYRGGSYYENAPKLGYSSVSKGYGATNRNLGHEDQNLSELQFMLENERKKFKEAREKFQYDLDSERKLRIEFQNKLIKLKDEFSKKEITISELEFKLNNLLHQNQDLLVENQRLKGELNRLEEVYGGKIHELEAQLATETQNFEETTAQYNTSFENFKKEGQDYVEQLTFEYDRKLKALEEKAKTAQTAKRDLALENKKLNDILISNKLAFEEELRDVKNRAREEEIKKSQSLNKSFEQKVKMLEEAKELVVRRNQQLIRTIQDKERVVQEIQSEQSDEIGKLRQENSDLGQQNSHLNYLIGKLKSEIADKDTLIGRSNNEIQHELQVLRQQLDLKRNENAGLAMTVRDLRQTLKESETDWERRRRELTERCTMLDMESKKYKEEYLRICQNLKSKINQTINTVSYKKMIHSITIHNFIPDYFLIKPILEDRQHLFHSHILKKQFLENKQQSMKTIIGLNTQKSEKY